MSDVVVRCPSETIDNRIAELKEYLKNFPNGAVSEAVRHEIEYLEESTPGILTSEQKQARALIKKFCNEEYGSDPDFSDMTNIGIAYTTLDDEKTGDEVDIQVSADLDNYAFNTYLDSVHVSKVQYENLADMIEHFLKWLNFDSLITVTCSEWDTFHSFNNEYNAVMAEAARPELI